MISHTNAAIDQIKHRLRAYCPKLLYYPNYLGTIQGFVDSFLAIPFFSIRYGKKLNSIDDDIYNEHQYLPRGARAWFGTSEHKRVYLNRARVTNEGRLITSYTSDRALPKLSPDTPTYRSIVDMKQRIREQGILCYDDAYIMANEYIERHSIIIRLLRGRFRYVFVDEMQDVARHQYDMLEKLFYDPTLTNNAFQRIGDINQAIFGSVKPNSEWDQRDNIMTLPLSYRLPRHISTVVRYFGLEDYKLESANLDINIKPKLIVYDDDTIMNVIPRYARIVSQHQQEGLLPRIPTYPIKVLGWVKKENEERNKTTIPDYYPAFESKEHRPRHDYSTLIDYLLHYEKKGVPSLRPIRKYILYGLLKILRKENVFDPNGRIYSLNSLINEIRLGENILFYEDFKLELLDWSKKVFRGEYNAALDAIRKYLPIFLAHFGVAACSTNSKEFTERHGAAPRQGDEAPSLYPMNCYNIDGLNIEIGTIHSAKGETHTATLYLECFYQGKYESEYLIDCFNGNKHGLSCDNNRDTYKKNAIKMAYVGFSRPTHLLCFAVHKDRLDGIKDTQYWEILDDLVK